MSTKVSPPEFRDIATQVAIIYYDFQLLKQRIKILMLPEFHERDRNLIPVKVAISETIDYNDCTDIHVESTYKFKPYKKIMLGTGKSNLSKRNKWNHNGVGPLSFHVKKTYDKLILQKFLKQGFIKSIPEYNKKVRFHADDIRGTIHKNTGIGYLSDSMRLEYTKNFYLSDDDILALMFGIGPSSFKGEPKSYIMKSIRKNNNLIEDGKKISEQYLKNNRSRARKTLMQFKNKFSVPMTHLIDVFRSAIQHAKYGRNEEGSNYGFEAVGDIYAFLRMFRTFDMKRKQPCNKGQQNNIIYVSHLGHTGNLMLLIYKVFNKLPNYYESIYTKDSINSSNKKAIIKIMIDKIKKTTPKESKSIDFEIKDMPTGLHNYTLGATDYKVRNKPSNTYISKNSRKISKPRYIFFD